MTKTMALTTVGNDSGAVIQFIDKVTNSLMFTNMTPPERESAAMICALQMVAEGLTFAELRTKFHIYPDGLEQRAEYVHAALERIGWNWTWKKDGEDGEMACFQATRNGVTREVSFTIQMARRKGLVKKGSTWETDAPLMLRARCVTRFATMWAPQIGAGIRDDFDASGGGAVEVQETSTVTTTETNSTSTQSQSTVEDADFTPVIDSSDSKPVTLDSMVSAIDFPKRAFTSFARQPRISTLGELCRNTYDELVSREGMGVGTASKIVEMLQAHGMNLAAESSQEESLPVESSSSPESTPDEPDVQPHTSESTGPADNSDHGEALARVREICTYEQESKDAAIAKIKELWPDKKSLYDLDSLETHLLLVYILARKAGVEDKADLVMDKIKSDPHPIDRAKTNIKQLDERIKN